RIVLGPSTDGGYYLIGMKRPHVGLFEHIAWSTARVFPQTITRAEALGLSVFELPTWYDVDDAESLQTLIDEVIGGKPFCNVGAPTAARSTRHHLSALVEGSGLQRRMLGTRAARGFS